HGNTRGMTFRAGAVPPIYLKWYIGQGGVTGTRSGTPIALAQPGEHRAPSDAPPLGWDPESVSADDAGVAGGDARRDRVHDEAHAPDEPAPDVTDGNDVANERR